MKATLVITAILIYLLTGLSGHADTTVENQLRLYQQQGASLANSDHGEQLWRSKRGERSCTSCHGSSPTHVGKHQKTGKAIQPMAHSINPDRYRDAKKIKKWFLRNCKWTYGRECNAQEKSDILAWLIQQ